VRHINYSSVNDDFNLLGHDALSMGIRFPTLRRCSSIFKGGYVSLVKRRDPIAWRHATQ
jgi:hypothetical protein